MRHKQTYSAGGVVVYGQKVLLVCENGNFWGFPKGRIEPGEAALAAAKREITEETGCQDFALVDELGTYKRHPFTLQNKLDMTEVKDITMYLFRATSTMLHPHSEEKTEGQWVAKDAVNLMLTHPQDREFYASVVHQI